MHTYYSGVRPEQPPLKSEYHAKQGGAVTGKQNSALSKILYKFQKSSLIRVKQLVIWCSDHPIYSPFSTCTSNPPCRICNQILVCFLHERYSFMFKVSLDVYINEYRNQDVKYVHTSSFNDTLHITYVCYIKNQCFCRLEERIWYVCTCLAWLLLDIY